VRLEPGSQRAFGRGLIDRTGSALPSARDEGRHAEADRRFSTSWWLRPCGTDRRRGVLVSTAKHPPPRAGRALNQEAENAD